MNTTNLEQQKKYIKCKCLDNLLKNKVTPALFLGAGFSKRYILNYPDWWTLLTKISEKIGISSFRISRVYDLDIANGKTKSDAYLHITEILENELNEKIVSGKDQDILTIEDKAIISKNHYDPLKYLVSQIFTADYTLINENYLAREIERFSCLKNNIPCIFTTNYDTFIESLFSNYKCFTGQQDYFYNDNTDFMEIYKLHGTANQPNSLVLTKDDYDKFNSQSYLSIAKLITILSERPMIFIGYSLSDPNIMDIINKIISCLNETQLSKLEKNFIIIDRQEGKRSMQCGQKIYTFPNNSKGFRATYISTDNFLQLYWYLNQFKPTARPSEIRKYKLQIKKLIETNDPKLKTFVATYNSMLDLDPNIAITEIGASSVGYSKYDQTDLLLDALYDKHELTPSLVLDQWFMQHVATSQYAPLYYYLKSFNLDKATGLVHEKTIIREKLNRFHDNKKSTFRNLFNRIDSVNSSRELDAIIANHNYKPTQKILIIAKAFYNDGIIDDKDCRSRLIKLYEKDNALINNTELKKAIVLLDYNSKLII